MRPLLFYSEKLDWFYKVIPLSYLLDSSKFVAPLRLQGSQTLIVKALRSYASDVVDVRLLVSEPSSSSWFGNSSAGGYEIRRKDWADNAPGCFGELSKVDWEKQTIYVVWFIFTDCHECFLTFFYRRIYHYSIERYQESHASSFPYSQQTTLLLSFAYKELPSLRIIRTDLAITQPAKGSHW